MKKIFICALAIVTLAVVGVSCKKAEAEGEKEKTCVCDRTVTYNSEVLESTKAQQMDGCKIGRISSSTISVKYKTGETVTATETITCYAQ